MSPNNLKSIPNSMVDRFLLSSRQTVRKVYDAIPLCEAWVSHQILGELRRQGVGNIAIDHVIGTCAVLARAKLIKEIPGQGWIKYPTHSLRAKAEEREQIKQQKEEDRDAMKIKKPEFKSTAADSSVHVINAVRNLPASELHGMILDIADALGDRISSMTGPTAEMETELKDLRRERGELIKERDSLTEKLAIAQRDIQDLRHDIGCEIRKAQKLADENGKLSQLKTLLREVL